MIAKEFCICCGHNGSFYPLDYEHCLTRKAHPELAEDHRNISVMCRRCHTEKGMKGVKYMAEKYPTYKAWLIEKGWRLCEVRNKWVLDKY
jgi:hypothetical protein